MTTAIAHPNIALVKYWGKQQRPGNYPATPSLSITLADLTTSTTVTRHPQDEFWLDGKLTADAKVAAFLALLRKSYPISAIKIETNNNFPTGAGLASSASGFAALITALNSHFALKLSDTDRSSWARQGSASAARSIFSGFISLAPPIWHARTIAARDHWPLDTVVAITSGSQKTVSSTQGMESSRTTSSYYQQWVSSSSDDLSQGIEAVTHKDFEKLAGVAELSCLKMHSVMLTTVPTLAYWNPATFACMNAVRDLRKGGTPVFFTIDAGPQLKAICEPQYSDAVAETLANVTGVHQTMICGMGGGARTIPDKIVQA